MSILNKLVIKNRAKVVKKDNSINDTIFEVKELNISLVEVV